ncbi:glycosyltransferase family A protein [Pseudomonas sp. GD03903]|nr:glycosyltransferase family A protein [Pseudomonas sp. GD03903]MDH1050805.1 glycosyltransferase family 2 protein [Pseudomonas sp. GD03903]
MASLRRLSLDIAFQVRPWLPRMLGDSARKVVGRLLAGPEIIPRRESAVAIRWPAAMPLVSVIVPCFNYGRFLPQALRSVRRQTLQDIELILVDDGSDDPRTLRVIRRLARWAGLRVVRQGNSGPGVARNAGIAVAKGRYICCLDADDLLAPDYLEKCVIVLEADSGTRLVHSWMQLFGDECRLAKTRDLNVELLRFINHLGASAVYHRDDWQAVGGYSIHREQHEDWDFWIRLARIGTRGKVLAEPLFYYRRHLAGRARAVNGRGLRAYHELSREHPDFFANSLLRRRLRESYRQRIVVDPFLNLAEPGQYGHPARFLWIHLRSPADARSCREKITSVMQGLTGPSLQVVVEYKEPLPDWLGSLAIIVYRLPMLLDKGQWPAFVENFRRTRGEAIYHPCLLS